MSEGQTEVTSKLPPAEIQAEHNNRVTLANAVELSSGVVREIAGDEIADGIDGDILSNRELTNVLSSKILSYLINPTRE